MSKSISLFKALRSSSSRAVVLYACLLALPLPGLASVIPKASERECKKMVARGDQLYSTGAYHGSVNFYQQAVVAEPGSAEAHLKYGRALARLGSNNEALKELFQSLILNADHPEANLGARAEIASILMKQGNYDEAGGQLKQIVDLSPNDTSVRGNYALCLQHLGFVDAAIEQFKLILKTNSYDTVVLYNLGASYLRKGDGVAARKYFDRVVAIDPKHVMAYLGLANASMLNGDNQEALKCCLKAVAIAPENHYAFLSLGDVYEKLEEKGRAVEAYKRAIQINPRDSASRAALVKLLQASRAVAASQQLHASQ
ncbi:MAG: tetratricopeptide repeat protein [Candidatus Melainabacteria bacterium]|nr:tetratricopeptide repeat protein [Candidatus Melainabacteria bacterium]